MSTSPEPTTPEPRLVRDAVCTACGLLCDDITLTISGGRIVEADRACDRGRSWFLDDHRREADPAAAVDGRPATLAEAIDRASSILRRAKAPAISGLTSATVEAQSLAALLADRLGASIGPMHADEARPRIDAIRRAGGVFSSFGEVINRADVIVLWDLDPATTHPRLRERLIDRPGRFVPEGRAGRTVLAVDAGRSDCRGWADGALAVPPGRHAEAIAALRGAVRGVAADPDRVARHSGVPLDDWQGWADRLKNARYAAIFFGDGLAREGSSALEALMRLVDDLNRTSRCVTLPMLGPGNPAGAEAVLTGRLGAPLDIDLADGIPRHLPNDADPDLRARAGEADALLLIGEPHPGFDPDRLPGLPLIRIGPGATSLNEPAAVVIATSTPGIDESGTFYRSDEVALPIRPALDPIRPSAPEVLGLLLDRCSKTPDELPQD